MKFTLDTNILIHKGRNDDIWKHVKETYFSKGVKNFGIISFAAQAEVRAFAKKLKWGKPKLEQLEKLLSQLDIVHSDAKHLEKFYIQIDNYSQNQHKSLSLPTKLTARNMGKNDLWIAATAAVYNAPLISTDRDFQHLDNVFLSLRYIDTDQIRNPK